MNGGIVMVNFYPEFISKNASEATLDTVVGEQNKKQKKLDSV